MKKNKKLTPEEKEKQKKAVLRKLRKIGKAHCLDDMFRQMPKFNED